MLYAIYTDHRDGHSTISYTDAADARRAHQYAADDCPDALKISVYPWIYAADPDALIISDPRRVLLNGYALMRGALLVARNAADKTVGGKHTAPTETQWAVYYALCAANAAAAQTEYCDPETEDKSAALLNIISRYDYCAAADYIGYAADGMLASLRRDCITDIRAIYGGGYKALNGYILSLKTQGQRELSAEYIRLNGGDLIAYNRYIARIIRGGEKYAAADSTSADGGGGVLSAADRVKLSAALTAAAALLTPRQREIMRLLSRDLSAREIASRLHIKSHTTVLEHITHIRAKISAYITEYAPEFSYIISAATAAETASAAAKRNINRHK